MPGLYAPTPRQADLLRFIAGYQEAHDGISPTLSECVAALGLAGKSNAHRLITRLQERGHVRRLPRRDRAIELLTSPAIPRAPNGQPLLFVPVHAASAN